MQCPRCQHENPPLAKFCLECGARLAQTCAQCATVLPTGAKFCLECGQPVGAPTATGRFQSPDVYTPKHLVEKILTSKSALEGERKQVTVLFADLKVRLVWDGGVCRMLGLEFLAARSRLFQDGMGLGPVKASKARP